VPSFAFERRLLRSGFRAILGLDEAGRGCWAGPLVAAAVVFGPLTPRRLARLRDVRDSKQLSPARREQLAEVIRDEAVDSALGVVDAPTIDLLGLTAAGELAMLRATRGLGLEPDHALIDAFRLNGLACPQTPLIHGDARCLSIAAASILAKVHRDELLVRLDAFYPGYGFAGNKGYGTPDHQQALAERGPCPEHRLSYAPLRALEAGARLC
jgi:ribonuclease HII